jgi:hypothetical protein
MSTNQTKHSNRGRPVGSPNKSKLLRVEDLLAEKDINPIEEILKLIPTLEPRDQVKTWLDIQGYVQAKPRDIESQLILQKYETLVQVIGPEAVAAIEEGKHVQVTEAPVIDVSQWIDE